MKKIVLILILGVFAFGSSGFKADQTECQEYATTEATNGVMWYQENGFQTNVWLSLDLYLEALNDCEDNGVSEPGVFIAG